MVRRLLLAAALFAFAGAFGAARAQAARPSLDYSISSAHFTVHFDADPTAPETYATYTQASDLAALGERALTTETGWGYAAPPDDGDGHIDVYIVDLSSFPGVAGLAIPEDAAAPSKGYIEIAKTQLDDPWEYHAIAHEIFHLIQYRYWLGSTLHDSFLFEGEAEWAGYKATGYAGLTGSTNPPDLSADCFDQLGGGLPCSPDGYIDGGYSRWNFYEYLAQTFGLLFAKETLQDAQAAELANPASTTLALDALKQAIAAHGTTIGDAYTDFAVRAMTGGWGISALDGEVPDRIAAAVGGVDTDTGDVVVGTFSVDHLARRYVAFTRGDGAGDHPCFAATLKITVDLPAGVNSTPYFYWNQKGSSPVKLDVTGNTATTTIGNWDTCFWAQNVGYLMLPNPTTGTDTALFTVHKQLTVSNTPASPTTAPTQQSVFGDVTSVESAQVPPAITLLAPQTLKVSVASPTLRLAVQSNGDGAVHATLGSVDLGTAAVRAGNNVLGFTIPKSVLTTLRRSAAAGNLLTLTPVSPSGEVTGSALTRKVVVSATKPKAKPKKKK